MKNKDVATNLTNCYLEIREIKAIIYKNKTAKSSAYLTKYALMRICGCIEYNFKNLIIERITHKRTNKQIKNFLDKKFQTQAQSIEYSRICYTLRSFDADWQKRLKNDLDGSPHKNQIISALNSLSDVRNSFAHGGSSTITIDDLYAHLMYSIALLKKVDACLK
ncbi:MAG TPA: hypothetical protein EYG18_03315 [Micavibrio sp.]|nr:hypothetical protein [Micavibrio sp.]HIL28277.1 hypothetical protein [Micavibrio sp.]